MPTDDSVTMEAENTADKTYDHCMASGELEIMRRNRSDSVALDQSQVDTSDTSRIETLQTLLKRPRTHIFPGCPSGNFQHGALEDPKKQIRLVKLLPAHSDEIIRLECRSWWLEDEDMPSHHAISYTWGDVQTQLLFVNGEALHVRKNCYYALWQARLHFPGKWVWIDSISIDQTNDDEKSHQVQMMYDIYSSAGLVLSCVGPHADASELVTEAAQEILERLLVEYFKENDSYFDYITWASARGKSYFIDLGKSYEAFSQRTYWTRLWVIQEMRAAGLARERASHIICGHDLIELWSLMALDHFYNLGLKNAAETLSWTQISVSKTYDTALGFMINVLSTTEIHAEACLTDTRGFHCGDPRDKLYGLLSLLTWPDGFEAIKPDYSKSPWGIFLQIAPLLSNYGVLDALKSLQVGDPLDDLTNLASQRAYFHGLGPAGRYDSSGPAKRMETERSQKRQMPIESYPPLAVEVKEEQLRPLSQEDCDALTTKISEAVEQFFGIGGEEFDIKPYVPKGVFAEENLLMLVDHRTRAGDLILDLHSFLFVLRQRCGRVYEIVGSAMWNERTTHTNISSKYKKLVDAQGAQQGVFYARGTINLLVEDQMVLAIIYDGASGIIHEQFLPFVMQLIEEPSDAVTLDLEPYHFKTDISSQHGMVGSELLCFEGNESCKRPECRNKQVA